MVIKRLKIKDSIFMIETRNYDLVLEQLFLNIVKFDWIYQSNKIFGTITYPYTYQLVVFQILALDNQANKIKNPIFSPS